MMECRQRIKGHMVLIFGTGKKKIDGQKLAAVLVAWLPVLHLSAQQQNL